MWWLCRCPAQALANRDNRSQAPAAPYSRGVRELERVILMVGARARACAWSLTGVAVGCSGDAIIDHLGPHGRGWPRTIPTQDISSRHREQWIALTPGWFTSIWA